MAPSPSATRLTSLDQLRALAVLFVLLSHFGVALKGQPFVDLQNRSLNYGSIGVLIFFCISGFVLPWSMRSSGVLISVREFWTRRALRLWPVYLLIAAVISVFFWDSTLLQPVREAWRTRPWPHLLGLLSFTSHWLDQPTVFQKIEWTLAYEVVFYAGCSIGLALVQRWSFPRPAAVTALVAAVCALSLLPEAAWTAGLNRFAHMYLFFLAGFVLFLFQEKVLGRGQALLLSAALGGTALLRNALWWHSAGINYLTLAAPLALALFYMVMLGVIPLRSRVLSTMGLISYSIYLTHMFVPRLILPVEGLPAVARVALWTGVTLVISFLLFHAVEEPCIRLGRRLAQRTRQAPERDRGAVESQAGS